MIQGILWNREHVAQTAVAHGRGDAWTAAPVARLANEATAALARGLFAVTFRKGKSPSGDPHDYTSIGTYSWPNPNTPTGLPYIGRDGEPSPERPDYDVLPMRQMCDDVATLGLSAAVTGDTRHASHAARLLRTWYLDPATRMNPNLKHAQFSPGQNTGVPWGAIDTNRMPDLLDAIDVLTEQGHLSPTDRAALGEWFGQFLNWFLTSDFGKQQVAQRNNIATWLDVQMAAYAIFTGQDHIAHDIIATRGPARIADQIEPDGSQPHEAHRTMALSYSLYNLVALALLAVLGERVGVDLWTYRSADGRSVKKGIDFLAPFVRDPATWPHQQIYPLSNPSRGSLRPFRLARMFRLATLKWGGTMYEETLAHWEGVDVASHRMNLIYPRP